MPEVIEREGGARVVYVDWSIRIAEIEGLRTREERKRKEEKQKTAEAAVDVTTTVDEKAERDIEGATHTQSLLQQPPSAWFS